MVQLEEGFSLNDKYLIDEYVKHGTDDFLLFDVGDETFVVPYQYTVGAKTPKDAIEKCKKALFDFQNKEIKKYENAGEQPEVIQIDGVDIVIPRNYPQSSDKKEYIREFIKKAKAKYDTAINAHRALDLLRLTDKPVDVSAVAIERDVHSLSIMGEGVLLGNNSPQLMNIYRFIKNVGKKGFKKFKTNTFKLSKDLEQMIHSSEFEQIKKYRPKHWKAALLTIALATATYQGGKMIFDSNDKGDKSLTVNKVRNDNPYAYTDCFGREYPDTLGNLKLMNKIKAEITALILSIEGFADEAFLEGGERPTVGSGFTYYVDENGQMTPIQMGDKTNYQDNEVQIDRYLDLHFCKLLGDSVGKPLNEKEILACIGAGFCWGTDGFSKSSFFQSVKDGEKVSEQQRKLSGFRTPIGLVKREYLLAKVLSGEWTVKDLLDMPIYLIKGKGYLHCGIYPPDLHNYVPCKKDKKGNYIVDKNQNERPIICDDGFCMAFREDYDKDMLNRIIQQAQRGKASYKTVREMLPSDVCQQIEDNHFNTYKQFDIALKKAMDQKSNSL